MRFSSGIQSTGKVHAKVLQIPSSADLLSCHMWPFVASLAAALDQTLL